MSDPALEERRIPRALVCSALLEIGGDAVPRLLRLIEHPDPVERVTAVELVGLLGDAADGRAVAERLVDTSAEVRAQAARALERLGAADAAPAFADLVRRRHGWGEQRRRGIGRAIA